MRGLTGTSLQHQQQELAPQTAMRHSRHATFPTQPCASDNNHARQYGKDSQGQHSDYDSQAAHHAPSKAHSQAALQPGASQRAGLQCVGKEHRASGVVTWPDEVAAHSSTSEQLAFQGHSGQDCAHHGGARHDAAAPAVAADVQHPNLQHQQQSLAFSSTQRVPPGSADGKAEASGHDLADGAAAAATAGNRQQELRHAWTAQHVGRAGTASNAHGAAHSSNGSQAGGRSAKTGGQAAGMGVVPELAGDGLADPFSPGLAMLPSVGQSVRRPPGKPGNGLASAVLGLKRPAGISKPKRPQKTAAAMPASQANLADKAMLPHAESHDNMQAPAVKDSSTATQGGGMQSRGLDSGTTITVSPTAVRSSQGSGHQATGTSMHHRPGERGHVRMFSMSMDALKLIASKGRSEYSGRNFVLQ